MIMNCAGFSFHENSRFMPSGTIQEISVVQSVGAFALAGTIFCRSNRKQRKAKGVSAYENADRIYLPFGTGA